MDGENTTMYSDHIHARSLDSGHHESRSYVKQLHAAIKADIPEGWRICGENMYAKHSIHYTDLESYFMVFSIWDANNMCLSWEDTVIFTEILGLTTVPVLARGRWDALYTNLLESSRFQYFKDDLVKREGFVVRNAGTFHFNDFQTNVAKYVRADHIQTDEHWMTQAIVKNELK